MKYRASNLIELKHCTRFFADLLKTARNCIYHSGNGNGSRFMWKEGNFIVEGTIYMMMVVMRWRWVKKGPKSNTKLTLSPFSCITCCTNTKCNLQLFWTINMDQKHPNCTVLWKHESFFGLFKCKKYKGRGV